MSHIVSAVDVSDAGHTIGLTPLNLGVFEFPNNSALIVRVAVMATRTDLAAKAWTLEALVKKNGGTGSVSQVIPSPVNVFGSAADLTAMAGTTIAMYADSTYLGVTCTGQDGQDINWLVKIVGTQSTQ